MTNQNNPKLNLLIIGVIAALAFGWVTLYMVSQVQAQAGDITCQGYRIKFNRVEGEWIIDDPGFFINFKPDGQEGVSWIAYEPLEVTGICVKEGGSDGGTLHFPSPSNIGTLFTNNDVSHIAFNYEGDKGDITPTPTDEDKEETPTPTPTDEDKEDTPTATDTPSPTGTATATPTDEDKEDTPTPTATEIGTPTIPPKDPETPTPTATDRFAGGTIITRTTTWWQSFLNWLCQIGINLGQCT